MAQDVFAKAVKGYLPSAIPTALEKIDEYSIGKVLIYSRKPRKLFFLRKHELDFTGWSLQTLLADKQVLSVTTARSYLFDTNKETGSKVLKVDVGGDVDALLKLAASASADVKFDAGEQATLKVTTDFGKITHITTDLVNSAVSTKIQVQADHPIIQKAVRNGGTMFVISNIYEGEHCNVSAAVMKDKKEDASIGGGAEGGKADVKEDVEKENSSVMVVSRNQPTPLAYMLMKVNVTADGVVSTQLNQRFSETLDGGLSKTKAQFSACSKKATAAADDEEWVVVDITTLKKSDAVPAEAKPDIEVVSKVEGPPAPQAQPPEPTEAESVSSEVNHPYPAPLSEVLTAKVEAAPTDATDAPDKGMPDEHYLYSLKDFQPFESSTYRGIMEESHNWVAPFVSNMKLQTAFMKYTELPSTYEKLNELSAYFLEVGNAMRSNKTPPPNKLKDVEPIMTALSEDKGTRLNEISSVVIVAEAADEFPPHIIKKIFELPSDKRKILISLILQTPYGTGNHTYADLSPFKDPALTPIMKRMGFSILGGTSLTHTWTEADDDEDKLASALILFLASEQIK